MRTLKELRAQKGLTAFGLDDAAGVSRGFTTRVESGLVNPDNVTIGNAHKVSVVLGISLDEFYNITKNTEPNHQKGSPLMVKGEPRRIGGNRWKNYKKETPDND